MKINWQHWGSRESWEQLFEKWYRHIRQWSRSLLVDHSRSLELLAVTLAVLFSVYLIVDLLYLSPPGTEVVESDLPELNGAGLDYLVEWIESRAAERENDFVLPSANLFP